MSGAKTTSAAAIAGAAAPAGVASWDELLVLDSHEPQASAPPAGARGGGRGGQSSFTSIATSPAAAAAAAAQMHVTLQQQQQQQEARLPFVVSTANLLDAVQAELDEVLTLTVDSDPLKGPALQQTISNTSSSRDGANKMMQQPGSCLRPAATQVHMQQDSGKTADAALSLTVGDPEAASTINAAGSSQANKQPVAAGAKQTGGSKASEGDLHQGWLEEDWDESEDERFGSKNAQSSNHRHCIQLGERAKASGPVGKEAQVQTTNQQQQEDKSREQMPRMALAAPVPETGHWLNEDWDE
jgi:hypothetical protein